MNKPVFSISNLFKASLLLCLFALTSGVFGQMAPGNIVLSTVGNGSSTMDNAGWRVNARVIKQSDGSTLNNFTGPVNPSSGKKFCNSGTATSEGALTLSLNGRYLTMVGYDADSTNTGVAGTASSTRNRVIARVDSVGNYDVTTYTTSLYSANNIRGGCSEDGNSFYVSGNGTSSSNAGVQLFSLGSTSATQVNSSIGNSGNVRWSEIFASYDTSNATLTKGLYLSTGTGTAGIYQVGSGLPTSSSSGTAIATPSSISPYAFLFLDASTSEAGLDLLYITNDGSNSNNIQKFYKSGGTWTAAGTHSIGAVRGISGYITATGRVKLFFTRGNTSTLQGRVIQCWDNASYSSTINLQNNSNNNLSTSNYNILFSFDSTKLAQRGIAFTPTSFNSHPSNSSVCSGTSTSFTVAMYAPTNSDSAVYNYYWQRSNDGGSTWAHVTTSLDGSIYTNTRSASLSVNNPSTSVNTYQYRCLVQYMSQYWLYSNKATLTVNATPSAPSAISGNTPVCSGSAQTYSVTNVASTTYTWSLPGTWSGTSTTNSIGATVGTTGGNVSVTATQNGCTSSASTLAVSVTTTPVITLDPSGFTGCTNQSYTLTGSATNASSYQWRYNSSNIPLANTTSYTLNPASASNTGTYDIIAINGSCSDTSAAAVVSISGKITTYPYQDPLNSGADCYSTQAVSGSAIWTKTTSMSTGLTPSTGQMYVYPSSTASSGSAAALVTPTFDLTSISNPILTFRWARSSTNNTAKDSVNIAYSNDNFATTNFIRTAYRVHTGTNWQTNHVTLASLGGLNNVQFKFTGYAYGGGADIALDSIAVYESQCAEVSGESSSVNNNLVTLSWTSAPNTTYDLRYKPSTSSTWVIYSPSPVNSPITIYLNPNTTYNWQVRSICFDNAYGWPISSESFTTSSASINCLKVSGLQQTVSNCSTAVATWSNTATADSFVVRLWKYNTVTSVWVVVSNTTLTNAYTTTFSNLQASKDYRWRVIRYCNGVALNSALSTFSTPSCRMAGTNSDELISEVALYPNPNSGTFNLTFPSAGESYTLAIADLNGRIVERRSGISENGVTSLQIQVPNLASGLYFLTLTNSGTAVTKKLTIQ